MNDYFITIKISDREYSLKIDPKDEAILREAGKIIENRINLRKKQLGVVDKQDLLAMIAFDNVVENIRTKQENNTLVTKAHELEKAILDTLEV